MIPDFDKWKNNPAFERYIQGMVAKELEQERRKSNVVKRNPAQVRGSPVRTPVKSKVVKNKGMVNDGVIKSPSDTTIYAPALCRETDRYQVAMNSILNVSNDKHELPVDDQVAKFIEGVRIESQNNARTSQTEPRRIESQPRPGTSTAGANEAVQGAAHGDQPYVESIDVAKQKANKLILEAERFKATVNTPPGRNVQLIEEPRENLNYVEQEMVMPVQVIQESTVLDDDDFFHATCHVDPLIRAKIEKGGFIDLDKLLPKTRNYFGDDQKLNLVQRDGCAFFVPATSENKITNVRKWEQAFRIYAAIYSQANPSRAPEIWQYVHIINVAAGAYLWDNVSNYDVTFRHLMAQNPLRSWSKIYNQMWNISMRDVIPRGNTNQGFGSSNNGSSQNSKRNKGGNGRKPKYCWAHQRGEC